MTQVVMLFWFNVVLVAMLVVERVHRRWRAARDVDKFLPRARGRALTLIGVYRGIRRRWFEPDWMLRRRIIRSIRYWRV